MKFLVEASESLDNVPTLPSVASSFSFSNQRFSETYSQAAGNKERKDRTEDNK